MDQIYYERIYKTIELIKLYFILRTVNGTFWAHTMRCIRLAAVCDISHVYSCRVTKVSNEPFAFNSLFACSYICFNEGKLHLRICTFYRNRWLILMKLIVSSNYNIPCCATKKQQTSEKNLNRIIERLIN